jgi:hypothetical protein
MLRRWEHIRRFMQNQGPVWTSEDAKFEDFAIKFWPSLVFLQPLLDPIYAELRAQARHWWWLAPVGLFSLVFGLPLSVWIGLSRYLSYKLNAVPIWPRDVQASLGPEVSEEELAATGALNPKKSTEGKKGRRDLRSLSKGA